MKEFEDFTRNVKYYLSETLQIWLAQKDPPPTVQDLLDALRSPVLSNHVLAKKLEKKYKGNVYSTWFSVSTLETVGVLVCSIIVYLLNLQVHVTLRAKYLWCPNTHLRFMIVFISTLSYLL